jgi:pilus assembly protein TadC
MDVLIVALVAFYAVGGYLLVRAWNVRRLARLRIDEQGPDLPRGVRVLKREGLLERWLALAGFKRADAPLFFIVACVTALLLAIVVSLAINRTIIPSAVQTVADIPGGVGELFAVVFESVPWSLFIVIALVPVLVVRRARRLRVRELEHDLPLVLELFATLAQAGLGFDAALGRIVQSQPSERPLMAELMNFQRDLLSGVPRVQALRQLAHRADIMTMTIFVSAIIQAEHVGASISDTLRHQADDLRERRREQALLAAQSLPVKLVFPLVTCFLPGIFVSTLAPVLFQMVQVANSVLRPVGR